LHILRMVLGMPLGVCRWFGGFGHWGGFGIGVVLLSFLGLLTFVLWIICMVKAYQGVRFKLPLAGDCREYRWQVRAPGAQMNFGTTFTCL
jgi:hypothetical protein